MLRLSRPLRQCNKINGAVEYLTDDVEVTLVVLVNLIFSYFTSSTKICLNKIENSLEDRLVIRGHAKGRWFSILDLSGCLKIIEPLKATIKKPTKRK